MMLKKLLNLVEKQVKMKNYIKALNLCNNAIKEYQNFYEIYEVRSELYFKLCEYDKAFNDLQSVILLQPKEPAPHFRKGRWELKLCMYEHSIQSFTSAIKLDTGFFFDAAHYLRAKVYLIVKDYANAYIDCQKLSDNFHLGNYEDTIKDIRLKALKGLNK